MNKKNIIKQYISFLTKNDIIVFAGKSVCQEASKYSNSNILCLDDDCGYGMSMAIGIAMGTKKRVCFICEDYYLLKDVGAVVHMGVSKLKNLFVIIIIEGYYPFVQNMPTIETSLSNFKGLLFGSGFLINDYSHFFKTQTLSKTVKSWMDVMRGPLALFISPSKVNEIKEYCDETDYNVIEQIVKLKTIINDETTSLFVPSMDTLKTTSLLTVMGKSEEK